ncbi:MAG: SpoIIE family protein phosphatase [Phycisphaeraceae bacterium]|nr:SpoIIE family protein phosphatase [Phycisphaeraceae bacterium]
MIYLGTLTVRDRGSVVEIRDKVLSMHRALGAGEIPATRAATALSEVARRLLLVGPGAPIVVSLVSEGEGAGAEIRFDIGAHGASVDPSGLAAFFDRVSCRTGDDRVAASFRLPALVVDPAILDRVRARLASKSRSQLMEELRETNRQLEQYNESLEATVAARTAELRDANTRLQRDLDAGAEYMLGLIPPPAKGAVSTDWRFIPSTNLGGDSIGYHWIDTGHFAIYLIDVTGHGLDAALLAVTITSILRAGSLTGVDMRRPEQVLFALNNAFQGERHGQKYFTMWYGVYAVATRRLAWSGGGHHPAVLLLPGSREPALLESGGPIVGCVEGMDYDAESLEAPAGSRLLVFSDGVFEILRDGALVWNLRGVLEDLAGRASSDDGVMDDLLSKARTLRGDDRLDDDFSIIEAVFH